HRHRRHLHSFPTRRSSDLPVLDGQVAGTGQRGPRRAFPSALRASPARRRLMATPVLTLASIDPVMRSAAASALLCDLPGAVVVQDRKSTRLNSSHVKISYA